ncbi:MAG: hypothetical protein J6Y37_16595 [Paludibacteraceae bacterium]|nr:hypothetical protein [Paludibacteraceae bacterium]
MVENRRYTLGELNAILESANEFKPRKGDGVDGENRKNNGKAVADIMDNAKKYDGGLTGKTKNDTKEDVVDYNKTTLDVNFAAEPSDSYVDRVKAQVHGYPSVDNEKNSDVKDNDSLEYDGNKRFYDADAEKMKDVSKRRTDIEHAGLKSHNLPRDNFKQKTIFGEGSMKRLHYKNRLFLSEQQLLNTIPEEFKEKSGKFLVKDKSGTEYLVECQRSEKLGYSDVRVLNKFNKQHVNEEIARINELACYSSGDFTGGTTATSRLNSDTVLSEDLRRVKEINDNNNV